MPPGRLDWINSFSIGDRMKRFIEGEDRKQVTLLPECLDDIVAEDNPVRIIKAFVEEPDYGVTRASGVLPFQVHATDDDQALCAAARKRWNRRL
jgi:hypothetical protein